MSAVIMDGKKLAKQTKDGIAAQIKQLKREFSENEYVPEL